MCGRVTCLLRTYGYSSVSEKYVGEFVMQMIRTWLKKNWNNMYDVLRGGIKWFFFQVISCVIPMLVGVVFAKIIGYEVEIVNIFPDFLLAAFAVGMNLWGFGIGKKEKVPLPIRDIYRIIVFLISATSALLYVGLFNDGFISEKVQNALEARGFVMEYMIGVFCFLIIVDVILAGISTKIEQKNIINSEKEVLHEPGAL